MSTAMLEMPDVVGYVLERADEHDLDALNEAMRSRRQALREKAAAAVKPGVTVTIRDISPKYLDGLTGTVKAIDTPGGRKRCAVVTLDKASTGLLGAASNKYYFLVGKDSYDLSGVPLSCCRVTDT